MSDPTIERLAANPVGVDQIDRAREICGHSIERAAKRVAESSGYRRRYDAEGVTRQ